MDYHLEWFRKRLSRLFFIPDLEYIDVLINDNYEQLKRFFDDEIVEGGGFEAVSGINGESELEKRILFVYRTFYDRLVEKEITVLEEVPHVPTPEPEPVKEKKRRGKGGGGGGAGKIDKKAPPAPVAAGKDLKDEDAEVKLDRDFLLESGGGADNLPQSGKWW